MVTKKTAAPKDTTIAPTKAPAKPAVAAKPKAVAKPVVKVKVDDAFKPSIAMDAPAAAVNKLIVSIKTRGAKLDRDLHSCAMACLFHADKHGDITLMNGLITAMPKTVRRNALMVWAMAFGKFALQDDKAKQELLPLAFDKTKTTNLDGAQAKPFWEFRNVREGGTEWLYMDFIGNVMKTLSRVALDVKNPEHAKAKAALDALNAVNEALNTQPTGTPAPTQATAPAAPAMGAMPALDRRAATSH